MTTVLEPLGRIIDLLRRLQELLAFGGIALALLCSLLFIGGWALSHLRKPQASEHPWFATGALVSSFVPMWLTGVAALGALIPHLKPYVLQCFALAVAFAALSWCIAMAALLVGGSRTELRDARRALLLAGSPWYCLVVYLSTLL